MRKNERIKEYLKWHLFYVAEMGKTELLNTINGDKNKKKSLLEELIKENIIETKEILVGVKNRKRTMVSLNPEEKERLNHLNFRVWFVSNPIIEKSSKNIGKLMQPQIDSEAE